LTSSSLIVPVWNGRDHLPACLDAALLQLGPCDELIVVDNGSADGSAGLVRAHYPGVRLLESERNLGFAGGCNAGLKAARGEFLFLLNQDVVLQPGWLATLRDALADPGVGIVGSKLLYPDGTLQHAGGTLRWPRAMPGHRGVGRPDDGGWDTPQDVDYVTGAACGLRRDTFELLGPLDVGFWPAYYEDTDYCLRCHAAGRRVVVVGQAVGVHAESTALGRGSPAYLRAFHRGRLRFALKHLEPVRFLRRFVPAEREWLRDEAPEAERVVLPAVYRAALGMLPELYRGRRETRAVAHALEELGVRTAGRRSGMRTDEERLEQLETQGMIHERPFRSRLPVVGGLVARFRALWNEVATRWYVLPMLEQQNAFNRALVDHVREMNARLEEIDARLVALDRDQTALARELAELGARISGRELPAEELEGD
jgi:GT2 family glycosyltransferase